MNVLKKTILLALRCTIDLKKENDKIMNYSSWISYRYYNQIVLEINT